MEGKVGHYFLEGKVGQPVQNLLQVTTAFIGRLQHLEIDVRPYISDKGRKRISYELDGITCRGSKLLNGSFPKLIEERGIDFQLDRDRRAMEIAMRGEKVDVRELTIDWSQIDLSPYLPSLKSEAEEKL